MSEESLARLVVVDNTYHQFDGQEPLGLVHRYSRVIRDSEQVYVRKVKIGAPWQEIDAGWVKGPALIVLENREGLEYQVNPTHEERGEDRQKVVVVGFVSPQGEDNVDGIVIQPGEHVKFQVADLGRIRLRCEYKEAKVMVHLVPL